MKQAAFALPTAWSPNGSHGRGPREAGGPRLLGVEPEIVARAEGAPGASQDDDVAPVVAVGLGHGRAQLLGHLVVDGVELLGTVQGDPGDAPGSLVEHRGRGHESLPPPWESWNASGQLLPGGNH